METSCTDDLFHSGVGGWGRGRRDTPIRLLPHPTQSQSAHLTHVTKKQIGVDDIELQALLCRCLQPTWRGARISASTGASQLFYKYCFRFTKNMKTDSFRWVMYIIIIDVLPLGRLQSAGKLFVSVRCSVSSVVCATVY